jgi:hypothetical protein
MLDRAALVGEPTVGKNKDVAAAVDMVIVVLFHPRVCLCGRHLRTLTLP